MTSVLTETQQWCRATFPQGTVWGILTHLERELAELCQRPHDAHEIADVVILCCALAEWQGIDLDAAVRAKLAINRTRTWGQPDAEGAIEHVRGEGRP